MELYEMDDSGASGEFGKFIKAKAFLLERLQLTEAVASVWLPTGKNKSFKINILCDI